MSISCNLLSDPNLVANILTTSSFVANGNVIVTNDAFFNQLAIGNLAASPNLAMFGANILALPSGVTFTSNALILPAPLEWNGMQWSATSPSLVTILPNLTLATNHLVLPNIVLGCNSVQVTASGGQFAANVYSFLHNPNVNLSTGSYFPYPVQGVIADSPGWSVQPGGSSALNELVSLSGNIYMLGGNMIMQNAANLILYPPPTFSQVGFFQYSGASSQSNNIPLLSIKPIITSAATLRGFYSFWAQNGLNTPYVFFTTNIAVLPAAVVNPFNNPYTGVWGNVGLLCFLSNSEITVQANSIAVNYVNAAGENPATSYILSVPNGFGSGGIGGNVWSITGQPQSMLGETTFNSSGYTSVYGFVGTDDTGLFAGNGSLIINPRAGQFVLEMAENITVDANLVVSSANLYAANGITAFNTMVNELELSNNGEYILGSYLYPSGAWNGTLVQDNEGLTSGRTNFLAYSAPLGGNRTRLDIVWTRLNLLPGITGTVQVAYPFNGTGTNGFLDGCLCDQVVAGQISVAASIAGNIVTCTISNQSSATIGSGTLYGLGYQFRYSAFGAALMGGTFAAQQLDVPAGTSFLNCSLWAGGGTVFIGSTLNKPVFGGCGGYTQVTIPYLSNAIYYIYAGANGYFASQDLSMNGGLSGNMDPYGFFTNWQSSGGSASYIFMLNGASYELIAVAGGGAGCGSLVGAQVYLVDYGGSGGGTLGQNGNSEGYNGFGGGNGLGGNGVAFGNIASSVLNGSNAVVTSASFGKFGGQGGGYIQYQPSGDVVQVGCGGGGFGGGGAGYIGAGASPGFHDAMGGGGGGYINLTYASGTTNTGNAGSGVVPGSNTDPNYVYPAGLGGNVVSTTSLPGNGYIVVSYS